MTKSGISTKEETGKMKQSQTILHLPQMKKRAKLHPLMSIQMRRKICRPAVIYVILLGIVDKDIYVKRTWFSDYFQTYLTPFIEYGMCNSNHLL
jgi:hypothetical protein